MSVPTMSSYGDIVPNDEYMALLFNVAQSFANMTSPSQLLPVNADTCYPYFGMTALNFIPLLEGALFVLVSKKQQLPDLMCSRTRNESTARVRRQYLVALLPLFVVRIASDKQARVFSLLQLLGVSPFLYIIVNWLFDLLIYAFFLVLIVSVAAGFGIYVITNAVSFQCTNRTENRD
jgi:hypothetical protein